MDIHAVSKGVIAIAKEAGSFIRRGSSNFNYSDVKHKGLNDMVSYIDEESEKLIVKGLKELLPEASVIAEEGNNISNDSEYTWVIDPLDGTTNFVHGLPAYAVSLALLKGKEPIIGVVYEISRDECFSAIINGGAYLNDKPIQISNHIELKDCLMATGFPVTIFDKIPAYMQVIQDFIRESHGVRRFGSAAMDLAYVACGRFDGFFEYNLNSWDVAAGVLIVKEAGGEINDFRGGDDYIFGKEIIAGNKAQGQMLDVIKRHW
jgi:myo-inositol-1(or 4)-monophosphatase